MIAFLVRAAVKTVILAGLVYVVCFVKLGKLTTFEHARRIAGTHEAHEFESEVVGAVDRAKATALEHARGNAPTVERTR